MPFARILRSSALMGGAQVVVLAAGFVRAKVIALLLGASGVGLIGIFNAFSGNVASFAGWGLGTSGVRLIAGAEEAAKPAKAAAVRRLGWMLSLLGFVAALALFWPVTRATFASSQYALEMAIVALAVPCVIASTAWAAVLQASGKIASLAKVQIAGALTGLLLGLPAIYCWGTIGIAVSILLAAAVPAFVLWRTARSAQPPALAASVASADLRHLVELGGALMVVGWLGQLSAYAVRLAIVRQSGLEAAGYYQAAYAISGSLPGFVFAAMGADFFPRVAAAKDEAEAVRIVETQIQAALLLGAPIIMSLITLGKFGLLALYSTGFEPAAPLLDWMAWTVFVRLMTWPLGLWLLAKGSRRAVILLEAGGALLGALLTLVALGCFGLIGAGFGALVSTAAYGMAVLFVFRRKTGVWFSRSLFIAAGLVAAVLGVGQWYAKTRLHAYAEIVPVLMIIAACAAYYFFRMRQDAEVSE